MKFSAINEVFTKKVSEYLTEGYIFNPKSMSGHQGEIGKVDLVKGEKLIRVWISSKISYKWSDENAFHGNLIVVRVGLWNKSASQSYDTVWMKDFDVLDEVTFYEISRDRWYVDNLEEALEMQRTRMNRPLRYFRENPVELKDDKSKEIAVRYLKRTKGYQRVSRDKITVYKTKRSDGTVAYRIHYGDKNYKIN